MEELVLLTQHLGISNDYAIVGQSWGGMLGMQFAITQPKGLKSMVIADSFNLLKCYQTNRIVL